MTEDEGIRRAKRRFTLRVLALFVGPVMSLLGVLAISSANIVSDPTGPPNCRKISDAVLLDCVINSQPDRTMVVTEKLGKTIRVDVAVALEPSDPLAFGWAPRFFKTQPFGTYEVFGSVSLVDRRGNQTPLEATLPRMQEDQGKPTLLISFVPPVGSIGALNADRVVYSPPVPEANGVGPNVSLSATLSDGSQLVGVSPYTAVKKETSTSVTTYHLRKAPTILLYLTNTKTSGVAAAPLLGGGQLDRWGPIFWTTAPWLLFAAFAFRARRKGRLASPTEWLNLTPVALGLLLFSLVQILEQFKPVIQTSGLSSVFSRLVSFLEGRPSGGSLHDSGGAPFVVMVVAPLAIGWAWSLVFRRDQSGVRRPVIAMVVALLPLVAFGVFVHFTALFVATGLLAAIVSAATVGLGSWALAYALGARHGALAGIAAAAVTASFAIANQLVQLWWVPYLAHFTAALLAVAVASALASLLARTVWPNRPTLRFWLPVGVAAVVAALSIPRTFTHNEIVGVSELSALLTALLPLTEISLFVLLAAGLASAGPGIGEWTRRAALLVGIVLMFRSDTTYFGVPLGFLLGTALLSVFLLRSTLTSGRAVILGEQVRIDARAREYISAVGDRRIDREFATGLRSKFSSGDVSVADYPEMKKTVENKQYPPQPPSLVAYSDGLAWGGIANPMRRGAMGFVVAAVVGAPFSLDLISRAFEIGGHGGGVVLLPQILGLFLGLRFPLYGFAFGYLLPALRGNSALVKSIKFAAVLIASEVLVVLIPFDWNGDTRIALLLRCVQIMSVMLALGVAFDIRTLWAAGFQLDRLGDLYQVNKLTVWTSGIVIAATSAAATALLSAAASELISRIVPGSGS